MLRIIPPARLATATDEDTRRIKKSGVPAAMIAGGIKWCHVRNSHDKRCVTGLEAGQGGWWGWVLPYGPKGYGFSAVLVIKRVSILADFGHK